MPPLCQVVLFFWSMRMNSMSQQSISIYTLYLEVWRHTQYTTIGIKLVDITQLIPNTFLALGLYQISSYDNLYKLNAIIYTLKGYHLCILFNHIRCLYLTLTFMLVPFKVIIKINSLFILIQRCWVIIKISLMRYVNLVHLLFTSGSMILSIKGHHTFYLSMVVHP